MRDQSGFIHWTDLGVRCRWDYFKLGKFSKVLGRARLSGKLSAGVNLSRSPWNVKPGTWRWHHVSWSSKIYLRSLGPSHIKYLFTMSSTLNKRLLVKEAKVKFYLVLCVLVYSIPSEDFWAVSVIWNLSDFGKSKEEENHLKIL